jgi:hypothetical protein
MIFVEVYTLRYNMDVFTEGLEEAAEVLASRGITHNL